MKCDIAPETLVSLLYDELDLKEEKRIRKHLEGCSACQTIFEELCETTKFLEKWEDEAPAQKTVFIQEDEAAGEHWKSSVRTRFGRRLAWGIPLLVAAAMILMLILNFHAGYQNGQWTFTFGKNISEAQIDSKVEALLAEWQQQQNQNLVALIQESEARQRRDFTLALNEYAENQELKRQQDLKLVDQSLAGLQRQTEGRYYQTSTLINDLIRMSNYPSPQE
jgi:uncharacterized membrane protein YcjF (UPF0283 family)